MSLVINKLDKNGNVLDTLLVESTQGLSNFKILEEPIDLTPIKLKKLQELNEKVQEIANSIIGNYPEFERLTWQDQKAEALAWQLNSSTSTPLLDGIAQIRGITREDCISRVLIKNSLFQNLVMQLVGLRQKYEDDILNATDAISLLSINLEFNL